MYVACPSCKALYAISADQLRQANGKVRCGRCHSLFNAANAVFSDPREAARFEPALRQDLAQEIDELVGRALDQVQQPIAQAAEQAAEQVTEQAAEQAVAPTVALARPTGTGASVPPAGRYSDRDCYAQPVQAEFDGGDEAAFDDIPHALLFDDEYAEPGTVGWGAIAAVLLLSVVLLAQFTWWDRERLAQIGVLRPALDWLCKPLACDLPLRHDPSRLEMVGREVRNHPTVKDALLVNAAFVNRASYPQVYPVLQISFSDVSGTPIAVRRFMPEEYLKAPDAAQAMGPGERALVKLELVDPGERAVSYQFDFM